MSDSTSEAFEAMVKRAAGEQADDDLDRWKAKRGGARYCAPGNSMLEDGTIVPTATLQLRAAQRAARTRARSRERAEAVVDMINESRKAMEPGEARSFLTALMRELGSYYAWLVDIGEWTPPRSSKRESL